MTLDQIAQIVTVLSILPIAWAAISYVKIRQHEVSRERYERFFEVMQHLGKQEGSIASKMGAAFELRKYPEYSDVIIRLCEQTMITGDSAKMLKDELELTAKFLKNKA